MPHQQPATVSTCVSVARDEAVPVVQPVSLCRHTSTPAEVMFLYDEVYQQQQYLQQGVVLRQGGTVLDVGANIGLFSMLAAEVGMLYRLTGMMQTAAAVNGAHWQLTRLVMLHVVRCSSGRSHAMLHCSNSCCGCAGGRPQRLCAVR